ncbi:hypothetical protein C7974DRAFT_315826 [Boeremia exigua]|uniref:uncharacterized protein n=1 Tax=Boeremia exigua TaxID=749465 RepID=UPI001E8EDE48|nr:uncharacterized protein C7974DRAFT_315826 [Boeremia exigua]KAH6620550.1 hypothetical protein C7974DRAFT_315826 [Boeremia exigua]
MYSHSRRTSEVVVARSKRTGEKYPVRTSHLSAQRGPYLHYIDSSRLQACRCLQVQDHKKPQSIGDVDKHLAIAIIRYMDKFDLESCLQQDFYSFQQQQKIQWALRSVHAERFHYLGKDKDVVCRCNEPDHLSYRRVRNAEIQELCAEFFLLESTQTTCKQEQWREMTGSTPTLPIQPLASLAANIQPSSRPPASGSNAFGYDSPSMADLLKKRATRSPESRKHRSRLRSDPKSRPSSSDQENMEHLSNGPNGEADVPEDVWRVSRPSVYFGQHEFESNVSTPIGSSATTARHDSHQERTPRRRRPSTLELGAEAPGLSQYAAHGRGTAEFDGPIAYASSSIYSGNAESGVGGLEVSPNQTEQSSPASSTDFPPHVAELPSLERAAELDAVFFHSPCVPPFSPDFPELEGGAFEHVAELTGRSSKVLPKTSKVKTSSRRLSRLVKLPSSECLPCQEDFFLKRVEFCSRNRPAPLGNCSLCHNSLDVANKHTIRLPCAHYVHQECLVSEFRVSDLEFGNCPSCGMALCERTLHDRIDTDREAIFGQSFTNLRAEERIDLAQRGETVVCWSEEEVAATQLRLLKDYVDSHADELHRQWLETGVEPDWHGAVVIPVVQLFKGWNVPARKCRYFADRDAFYKLVVWAELVRLMNTIRDRAKRLQGEVVAFPQLNELHRKFMLAKDRYETEKKTWQTNRSGVLECEKIAQDAFSMAVSTHLESGSKKLHT